MSDAGSDAGHDAGSHQGTDAGDCRGGAAEWSCIGLSSFSRCGASWDATLAARTVNCDAGPGLDGYVGVGECQGLESVAWNTSFTGETAECFYALDGGALVGALQFTDRGVVLAGGHVASCTREPPPVCRPVCEGVPPRLQALCVGQSSFHMCRASAAQTLSEHPTDCDAGAGIVGYVAEGACESDLVSVRWTYGFPGDTMECFYEPDGGPWVGTLAFTDRGVLAGGRVGECTHRETASCRDGG